MAADVRQLKKVSSIEASFYSHRLDTMYDLWQRFVFNANTHLHLLNVYMANYDLFEQSFFSTAGKCILI